MTRSDSPSSRWSRQHGAKYIYFARAHAELAALKLNTIFRRPDQDWRDYQAYRCTWGDWYFNGHVAPEHWHVGRTPGRWGGSVATGISSST